MLNWTLTFLILAMIAGAFGFTGVAGASIGIAKTLFFIFIAMWVIAAVAVYLMTKK